MTTWKLDGTEANAVQLGEMRADLGARRDIPRKFVRTLKQLNLVGQTRTPVSVSSITRSGSTVTVTMAAAHAWVVGDTVLIAGASQTEYNNGWRITAVPTSTTFQFELAPDQSPATPATGTITAVQTSQFVVGALGDSVAGLAFNRFASQWQNSMPLLGLTTANSVSGDAWTADGTIGKEWDYDIAYAGQYWSLGAGTGVVVFTEGGANPICDYIAIYYVRESGAGTFKVQISTDNGSPSSWSDVSAYTSVDASNATKTWGRILIRRPRGRAGIRIVHLTGGRVRVTHCIFRSLSANGYNLHANNVGGSNFASTLDWIPEMRDSVFYDQYPTLFFVENKESPSVYETGGFAQYLDALTEIAGTEYAVILTQPVNPDAHDDAGAIIENAYVRDFCTIRSIYYFDARRHFPNFSDMESVGWEGDGVHPDPQLSSYVATLLIGELIFLFVGPHLSIPFDVAASRVRSAELLIGGLVDSPSRRITATGSETIVATASGQNFLRLRDSSGADRWVFSTHGSVANPSQIPDILACVASVGYSIRLLSGVFSLRNGYSGAPNAQFEGINSCVEELRNANTAVAPGRAYICTTGTATYTLPASATVGQLFHATASGGTVTIGQPDGVQIVGGSNATTAGTGGSLVMASNSAITLKAVTTSRWVLVAGTPGVTHTWN